MTNGELATQVRFLKDKVAGLEKKLKEAEPEFYRKELERIEPAATITNRQEFSSSALYAI